MAYEEARLCCDECGMEGDDGDKAFCESCYADLKMEILDLEEEIEMLKAEKDEG